MIEDSYLVEKARAGDTAAFGELVRKYQLDVRVFLRRRIQDAATADDLAQDVFIGAMNTITRLKQSASVRSWLISIARYKLIDFLRAKARRASVGEIDAAIDQESLRRVESADPLADEAVVTTLRSCIERLKPSAKALLNDYYFEQVTANEIAVRSNQKSSTVRMSLLRIRRALATCMRKRMGETFEP